MKLDPKTKKRKIDGPTLCDDVLFHILQYCDHLFVMKVGMKVSSTWRQLSLRLQLNYQRKNRKVSKDHAKNLASSNLSNLTSLTLKRCTLNADCLEIMLSNMTLVNLTHLSLAINQLGVAGAKVIASYPFLNLKQLILECNDIGDKGVECIVNSPYMSHLVLLDLNYNRIGNDGADAICQSSYLSNLTDLDLGDNKIGTGGYFSALTKKFFKGKTLQNLKKLNLEIIWFEDSDTETDYYIMD